MHAPLIFSFVCLVVSGSVYSSISLFAHAFSFSTQRSSSA